MKKLIIVTLLLLVSLTLTACNNDGELQFELIGEDQITVAKNTPYTEKGFIARYDGTDISQDVTLSGNINPTEFGKYEVTYSLDYKGLEETLTRTIYYREEGCKVIEDTNITSCSSQWSQYLHTYISLTIYYEGEEMNGNAQYVFNNVESILSSYHKLSDKYNNYEGITNVKTINDNPTETHILEPELFDLIAYAKEKQALVDNAFNIALGPVLEVWHNYREACLENQTEEFCNVPTIEELEAQSVYTDINEVILNDANYLITMSDNMSLDLGGISKGYISGILNDYLDGLSLRGYLLNNGESNISVGGIHPTRDNEKFLLAISDPTFQRQYYATLYLEDGEQLVTSGDYQKYYVVNGEIYHHIIDNETLMPERHARSVSVVTDEPALADLYSTALFTMTVEEGQTFVNNIDGLEAIWYGLDDTIYFSENFEENHLVETFELE